MAISRDASQDCSNTTASATTLAATYAATATSGKLLVAVGFYADQKLNIQTPSGWTKLIDVEHNSQTQSLAIFYKVSDGTETGVTITKGGAAAAMRVAAYQYSGAAAASVGDASSSAQSGASSVTTFAVGTTGTTAQADELVITAVGLNGSGTSFSWTNAGSPLHSLATNTCFTGQRIVSSVATYSDTGNWTGAATAWGAIGTFKASAVTPLVGSGFFAA